MIISNSNILRLLYEDVPEFEQSRNFFFDDTEMIQMGMFEKFMRQKLLNSEPDNELLRRGFAFLNKMAEHGTESVLDILTTGVFMSVKGHGEDYVNRVRKYLSEKALALLDSVN